MSPITDSYRITATFGASGSLWSADHIGVVVAAPEGTPVTAVTAGTVTSAGEAGSYGLRVQVTHPDGTGTSYSRRYRIDVTADADVAAGSHFGAVGSTGNSTGPHLHAELRSGGVPVDPVEALAAYEVHL